MKTFLSIIIAIVVVAGSTVHAQTTTVTLPITLPNADVLRRIDTSILAGETLEVLAFLNTGPAVLEVNGIRVSTDINYGARNFQNVVIAGPATVAAETNDRLVFTYRKTAVASVATQNIPSQTVAIPENTIAPADVILESSTDLNIWNSALPGSFTPSALKRFFRLRLVLH